MNNLIKLHPLAKLPNGGMLFGLEYVADNHCHSYCYLTIARDVVVATQLQVNHGNSITNAWSWKFFQMLKSLPPIKEGVRWFEHYTFTSGPTLDEVFYIGRLGDESDEVKWVPIAHDPEPRRRWDNRPSLPQPVAAAFLELTGESVPDFEDTGFEEEMLKACREAHTSMNPLSA